jgi:hypothetical protein
MPKYISDSGSDNENDKKNISESDGDSEEEIEVKPQAKSIKKNSDSNLIDNILPTEGVTVNDIKYKKNKNIANLCDYCNKFYDKRMIAKCEFGDIMCQHCYFFLNFSDPQPKYKWTLEKYIELCQSEHDKNKCEKFANGGGCHLCLYKCDIDMQKKGGIQGQINLNKREDANHRKITFSDDSHKEKLNIACDEIIIL